MGTIIHPLENFRPFNIIDTCGICRGPNPAVNLHPIRETVKDQLQEIFDCKYEVALSVCKICITCITFVKKAAQFRVKATALHHRLGRKTEVSKKLTKCPKVNFRVVPAVQSKLKKVMPPKYGCNCGERFHSPKSIFEHRKFKKCTEGPSTNLVERKLNFRLKLPSQTKRKGIVRNETKNTGLNCCVLRIEKKCCFHNCNSKENPVLRLACPNCRRIFLGTAVLQEHWTTSNCKKISVLKKEKKIK